jgi:hypothetical protein
VLSPFGVNLGAQSHDNPQVEVVRQPRRTSTNLEEPMPRLAKLALILAVAALAIAATRLGTRDAGQTGQSAAKAAAMSPMELMRKSAPLPELKIENLF